MVEGNICFLCLSCDTHLFLSSGQASWFLGFPGFYTISLDSQVFGLALKSHHWLSWSSSLQMADHGPLIEFIISWASSYYIHIYSIGNSTYILYFLLALFLCEMLTQWTPYNTLSCLTISRSRCLLQERKNTSILFNPLWFLFFTSGGAGSPLCFEHVSKS